MNSILCILLLMYTNSFAKSDLFFSGYNWEIKSAENAPPAENNWCSDKNSIFVDSNGFLHLKVLKKKDSWFSSAISLTQSLGYGIYEWEVQGPLDENFDAHLTAGFFLYQDDNHEYDIEIFKWKKTNPPTNTQCSVQPSEKENHFYHFNSFASPNSNVLYRLTWLPNTLTFEIQSEGYPIERWEYKEKENLISPGKERVKINYWMHKDLPPADNKDHELVIRSFHFRR